MQRSRVLGLALLVLAAILGGCVAIQEHRRASALDYLYPKGRVEAPAGEVKLRLPLRVGVAFAPGGSDPGGAFSEPQRREILKRVVAAFQDVGEVQFVEVLPTHNLNAEGGFENLKQAAGMYGMNLVALVSYDQIQFQTPRRISLLYWTLVGAYFVEGEQLETHTLLDANVFELDSRALLFSGSGSSIVRERSTPIEIDEKQRSSSVLGFEQATDELIRNLGISLDVFREHARKGTVRGMGTPRVQVQSEEVVTAASHAGAGALGPLDGCIVAGLVAAAAWSARRRRG
jgi:rhombotail lipoprotein